MRDARFEARYAHKQLKRTVKDDEVFCFYGEWDENEEDFPVREHHSKCKQYPEYGTGCANGWNEIKGATHDNGINIDVYKELDDACADPGEEVILYEAPGPDGVFDGRAEHPQGKQVEKNMSQAAVQEHVGNQLPNVELKWVAGQHVYPGWQRVQREICVDDAK